MMLESLEEYRRGLAARYRGSPLPGFLSWWGRELSALAPPGLRARMVPPRPALWVVAELDGALSIWSGTEQPERRDRFEAAEDAELLRDRWLEHINSFQEGAPEIRLCLPAEDVLDSTVELPMAVESNLATAIGYQLDQLTPFRANQVLHDHRVARRDTQHGRLSIDLRLIPLRRLEPLRERLARIGIRPHVIDTLPDAESPPRPEGFNLLPEAERPPYTYARARLNWMLAGIAAVILALVMAQSLYLRGQTAERLRAEVASLRGEAEAVVDLQRQLEDALLAANFLAERRRRQPVIIQVLDEVSRILPDDIWLQQVRVNGNELHMLGLADGSQRLIELVNDSPLLDNAEFRGAINVDPSTGQERFNAMATIVRGRAGHAAAAEPGE